jgi:hypothetical protein
MCRRGVFGRFGCLLVAVSLAGLLCLGVSGSVLASTPAPGWEAIGYFGPTDLPPGGSGVLHLEVYNVGAGEVVGEGPTLIDTLPEGLEAEASSDCEVTGIRVVRCKPGAISRSTPSFGSGATELEIPVRVAADASNASDPVDRVSVSGGGALGPADAVVPVVFGQGPAGLGFAAVDGWFSNADGTVDTQAGSHPYEFTLALSPNLEKTGPYTLPAGGEAQALDVNLPPGLVGDPGAVPECTRRELDGGVEAECPPDTQIGLDEGISDIPLQFGVYNMVPPAGVAAEFAFELFGVQVFLDARLRSGGDYGITEHANVPQSDIGFNTLTIWGVPGEHGTGAPLKPFLTLPTSCGNGTPPKFSVEMLGTWQNPEATAPPGVFEWHNNEGTPVGLTGCEHLAHFLPSFDLAPDTSYANTPAGLSVNVRLPSVGDQEGEREGLVAPNLQGASVMLPEGLAVNPGQATGLVACPPQDEDLPAEGGEKEAADGPPSCPAASRIGTIKVKTPLLADAVEKELEGGIYVLGSNPPNLELLFAPSGDGVNAKLIGKIHLDEATGRLTATFTKTPDLPIGEVQLTFDGGPQAALVTPGSCGTYTAQSDFTPWSSPLTADVLQTSSFGITGGVDGSACGTPPSFDPAFTAGTVNNQAGAFSAVSVTLARQDNEQQLEGVQVTTPPGLSAVLRGVERCGEPQASLGTCGAGSLIGHTTVAAGPGPDPLYVQGGQVFLTGPYKGAPFGLSIVVPAIAGPFNLGNVVVRAAVRVDPHTAQITIMSDPFPTILDGVPLQVKTVNVIVDRAGFTFNPTSCEPLAVGGVITSTQGTPAGVSSRFQVANCQGLPFKPGFAVSTQAKTSKAKGASLIVRYTSGVGQANTAKVAVSLPKQLPSRLTTIQQACPEAVFNANPAVCPVGSDIGTGVVTTPILAGALSGPVYLVSHGGAAFPDIVVILQGEGVTLDLVGSIDIKGGVTSSTFATVPDAPVTSFQLSLPEGPHSALATDIPGKAKGSLCGQSLTMPTTLTGQNGAVVKQSTKIAVTGCPKAKAKKKVKPKKQRKRAAKKKGK